MTTTTVNCYDKINNRIDYFTPCTYTRDIINDSIILMHIPPCAIILKIIYRHIQHRDTRATCPPLPFGEPHIQTI